MTRFVVDATAVLHLASARIEVTYNAEYVALTELQADALVTLDVEQPRNVEGIVATASIDALR